MEGQTKVKVGIDNDHLGQIVSGVEQEQKNVDARIKKGRNNIFGLLGPAFSYKCLLSPAVKIRLFRTHTSPILLNWPINILSKSKHTGASCYLPQEMSEGDS